ncbi:MAG TPA: methyltransferase domain-containing protein [Chthonomonadaceae bacterium]|nr:methyltransferase domain-containing protein [Chthonomonadaceae bacterium]
MHTYLFEMLECPACHGALDWTITARQRDRLMEGEARCRICAASYPLRDGIGLFLTPDLPREDLWQQADSHLTRYLREHPEQERRLMQVPPESLNPADQFFRSLVLEERGNYTEAQALASLAQTGLYTQDYLSCWQQQCDYLLQQLSASDGPIIDLASGRCGLVEKLAQQTQRPLVASDFSPRVLQNDRRRLESLDLYDRISLLAFDARRTPFRSGALPTLTTNLGLPNIREPDDVLRELHRIVSGSFLSLSYFYPEEDDANAQQIRELGIESFLYRRTTLEAFAEAGWNAEVENAALGMARPTPKGEALEGAAIDSLPVAETTLEWCVLSATPNGNPHDTP